MAITITKKTTKTKQNSKQDSNVAVLTYIEKIADSAGALDAKIKVKQIELKELTKEYTDMVKPIQSLADASYTPEDTLHASGKKYICNVGVKATKATVTNQLDVFKLFKKLGGNDLLSKVMKFGITDIRNHLTSDEVEKVLDEQKSGTRRLEFIKK